MTPRSRRRAPVALAVTALVALTVACGDDDAEDGAADVRTGVSGAEPASSGTSDEATGATATTVDSTGTDQGTTRGTTPAATAATTASTSDAPPEALTPDEAGYTTAVAEYLQSPAGVSLTAEQAQCAAPGWVEVITVERFESSDQSPDDVAAGTFETVELGLDEDQAQQLLDALTGCDVDLRELFLSSVAESDAKECIDRELSDDIIEQLLREALVNVEPTDALAGEIERVAEACGLNEG